MHQIESIMPTGRREPRALAHRGSLCAKCSKVRAAVRRVARSRIGVHGESFVLQSELQSGVSLARSMLSPLQAFRDGLERLGGVPVRHSIYPRVCGGSTGVSSA